MGTGFQFQVHDEPVALIIVANYLETFTCKSNMNLNDCFFYEIRQPEYPGRENLGAEKKANNKLNPSTPNPGHFGWGRVLSLPLINDH